MKCTCNTVLGFRLLPISSNRFKLLLRNFKKGTILRGPGHAAESCPRWPLGIRVQGDAQGEWVTVWLHVGAWCE